jgi:hypothetical protein
MRKPILCLDFDGVIHSYTSGWKGADVIPDAPVPGAIDFILRALDDFKVAIYSSRSGHPNGRRAMGAWLLQHLVEHFGGERVRAASALAAIDFPTEKPPALVTLDDRAVTFTGNWPGLAELRAFEPWNKRAPVDRDPAIEARIAERDRLLVVARGLGDLHIMDDRVEGEDPWTLRRVLHEGFKANGWRFPDHAAEHALTHVRAHVLEGAIGEVGAARAGFVAEIDAIPNSTAGLTPGEIALIELLKRIADALR